MIQRLPVLLCQYCQEETVLPSQDVPGGSEVRPYWPTDSESLTVACQNAHLTVHWKGGIKRLGVQSEDPNQSPSVFWKVEFICSHGRCGLPIIVHTRTEHGITPETVEARAYNVTPKPECPAGHADGVRLKRIARV